MLERWSTLQPYLVEAVIQTTMHKVDRYTGLMRTARAEQSVVDGQVAAFKDTLKRTTGSGNASLDDLQKGVPNLQKSLATVTRIAAILTNLQTSIQQAGDLREFAVAKVKRLELFLRHDVAGGLKGLPQVHERLAMMVTSFALHPATWVGAHLNGLIAGPAGVGKTRVANIVAKTLGLMGVLLQGDVVIVTRSDLVGQFLGQTAPRVQALLYGNLENIIFIDEAYSITAPDDAYAVEAITEIIGSLDKLVGEVAVIAAGYDDLPDRWYATNDGMRRRFPWTIRLVPYEPEELVQIFMDRLRDVHGFEKIEADVPLYLAEVIRRHAMAFKAQAGDMQNLAANVAQVAALSRRGAPIDKCIVDGGLLTYGGPQGGLGRTGTGCSAATAASAWNTIAGKPSAAAPDRLAHTMDLLSNAVESAAAAPSGTKSAGKRLRASE
jgi:SpoVK/Ycf46/Vps4 family AAA+-type ATPase